MSKTSEILFEYLHNIIYNPSKAELAVEELDEDFVMFGKGLMYFAQCFSQCNEFTKALSRGDLGAPLPPQENELAAPLKSLCASLKHLTWQSQQVAKGDYNQHVDFMGEFSDAFNTMIEQLADRQQRLEEKIRRIQKKTTALEQSNLLLTALMHHVPQQIIVMERDTHNIMLMNDIAMHEVNNDAQYVANLMQIMPGRNESGSRYDLEIQYTQEEQERYLTVESYLLEWNNANAEVFVISDISSVKNKMKKLEVDAYQDSLTHLYNRLFGMLTLDSWLHEKKHFSLIFADLDNLKYINDEYGHHEGDIYIENAAKYLKTFSTNTIVCRLGGDEFMLLVPDLEYDEAHATMEKVYNNLQNDDYLECKEFSYSISFGIVDVTADNTLSAGDILSAADEKMYQHKRMRKKARRT
jgi:diguanylate cyclase (GGDEF)-like protein